MKENYRDLTLEEMYTKRSELKEKYRTVRFNKVVGHVDNPLEKRTLRRAIARINTIIHQAETTAKENQE